MEILIQAGYLLSNLKRVALFAQETPYGLSTDCFRITAKDNQLIVDTNNLKTPSRLSIGLADSSLGIVRSIGVCLIKAKVILDLLETVDSEIPVTISCAPQSTIINIRVKKASFDFDTPSLKDFIELNPPSAMGSCYQLTEADFAYIIKHLTGFCATHDHAQALNGVLFSQEGNLLHIVATDRYKLGIIKFPIETDVPRRAVVPSHFLNIIKHQLKNSEQNVLFGFVDNQVYFKGNDLICYCSLISEEYPDYKNLINQSEFIEIPLPLKEVKDSLSRLQLVFNTTNHFLDFDITSDKINIHSHDNLTKGKEIIDLQDVKQEVNQTLCLDGHSMIEILSHFNSDCNLCIEKTHLPVLYKSQDHPSLTYLQTSIVK